MPNRETKGINIFRLDLQSGSAKAVTHGKVDQNPVCSPDSKFFLYTKLEHGRQFLMEMPVGGGPSKQLSDKFVNFAAVSPDGTQIAALAAEGQGANTKPMIEIIPAQGGLPVKSFPPSRFISRLVPIFPGRAESLLSDHREGSFQHPHAADRGGNARSGNPLR